MSKPIHIAGPKVKNGMITQSVKWVALEIANAIIVAPIGVN